MAIVNGDAYISRFLGKNMLLGGMWYSKEKQTMTTFLKPIIDEINTLYKEEIVVLLECQF